MVLGGTKIKFCIYKNMEKLHIIFGGASVEHDVSIVTALQTYNALKTKYDISLIYCNKDNKMFLTNKSTPADYMDKTLLEKQSKPVAIFDKKLYLVCKRKLKYLERVDIVLNCCHGGMGEDGGLRAMLEYNMISCTSADMTSSAICMNKYYAKIIAKELDIPVVDYALIDKSNLYQCEDLTKYLGKNLIVKPNSLGSSIGVVKSSGDNLRENLEIVLHLDKFALVEREISPLIEYNCAIIRDGDNILLSQIEQPMNKSDILSFEDKYINSGEQTRVIPANISDDLKEEIYNYSKKIYQHLSLNGVVRIDYLYDKAQNKVYLNEINTIPGSMAYYLFEGLGISYIKLMEILIKNAQKKDLQTYFASNILTNLTTIGK